MCLATHNPTNSCAAHQQQQPSKMTLDSAPQPSAMAAFRPQTATRTLPGAVHGATATFSTQKFRTPIKIEFNVSSNQSAFNLPKEHCAALKLLVAKDPAMEIVPKDRKPHITDLIQFPANEEAHGQLF
jgi:hypothetical protein